MCMNTPKITNKYIGKRLEWQNIIDYLKENNFLGEGTKMIKNKLLPVKPFLQKNYGKLGDCTLTSVLVLTYFYTLGTYTDVEIYDYIEKIAKKYLYNGDTYGTIPIFNKAIVKETFKKFGVGRKITTKYFKDIGFNLEDIKKILDANQPILISIYKDGRKYYEHHTITIVGYITYKDNEGREKTVLKVYDNWYTSAGFLDYDVLNFNATICY